MQVVDLNNCSWSVEKVTSSSSSSSSSSSRLADAQSTPTAAVPAAAVCSVRPVAARQATEQVLTVHLARPEVTQEERQYKKGVWHYKQLLSCSECLPPVAPANDRGDCHPWIGLINSTF
jgi:hypothetical protein